MATRTAKIMAMVEREGAVSSSASDQHQNNWTSTVNEQVFKLTRISAIDNEMVLGSISNQAASFESQDTSISMLSSDIPANKQLQNAGQESINIPQLSFDAGDLINTSLSLSNMSTNIQIESIIANCDQSIQKNNNEDPLIFIVKEDGHLSIMDCEEDSSLNDNIRAENEAANRDGPSGESKAKSLENLCSINSIEQSVDNIPENSDSDYIPSTDNDSDNPGLVHSDNELALGNMSSNDAEHGDMNEGRKRKHKSDQNEWKKIKNQKLRMEGKQYLGYTKPRNQTMKQNKIREARSLKPGCSSSLCLKSKKRMCDKFTSIDRMSIFTKFWSDLNWDQRKMYVVAHVTRVNTKRKTVSESRREESLVYTLTLNNTKYQVCRKMFLNTLDLRPFTVQSWTKKGEHGMLPHKEAENSKRMKKSPFAEDINFLKGFLEKLPKLPSHYNRANSTKLYLEPVFRSLKQVYDLYNEMCQKEDRKCLSNKTFYNQFNDSNLSLYQPKKDQCDVCVSYRVGNISNEKYTEHIKKKDRARLEKETDKKLAEEGKCIVLTMDLQAVKVCPIVQSSMVFFKTKLCCHNFTIYDVTSRNATCYWFTESDCDLSASAFVSCVIDYLERHCLTKRLPVIIYSDGCTYQNRNNVMANALLNYAVHNKINIQQKFLEKGHRWSVTPFTAASSAS
ncbi:unnamed protein product [Acanthoscelides obtectus]|uniref:Uncharacterized protein n=1 Tax=Acanthoscelides obtectus TaxID=200917 RepID=A0A9P0PS07_ACAOB|nr:unnamed protein product [Acanthoscelides obtectus]CAK1640338.1 hypothetical protein AOBTE_LOCUS11662 [Acanthoscelides obtectus]